MNIDDMRDENGKVDARKARRLDADSKPHHSEIDVDPNVDAPHTFPNNATFSKAQIATAIRRVRTQSDYLDISPSIYDDERPDHYPTYSMIWERFDSWTDAKEAAFPEE